MLPEKVEKVEKDEKQGGMKAIGYSRVLLPSAPSAARTRASERTPCSHPAAEVDVGITMLP